jgi:hypothetical protein
MDMVFNIACQIAVWLSLPFLLALELVLNLLGAP